MRTYLYLFVILTLLAVFGGVIFQAPDPGAVGRNAFLGVCEKSDIVLSASRSVDKAAMACACLAGWHMKRAPRGDEPFYPTQLYILSGPEAAAGLSKDVVAADAKARAACIK